MSEPFFFLFFSPPPSVQSTTPCTRTLVRRRLLPFPSSKPVRLRLRCCDLAFDRSVLGGGRGDTPTANSATPPVAAFFFLPLLPFVCLERTTREEKETRLLPLGASNPIFLSHSSPRQKKQKTFFFCTCRTFALALSKKKKVIHPKKSKNISSFCATNDHNGGNPETTL